MAPIFPFCCLCNNWSNKKILGKITFQLRSGEKATTYVYAKLLLHISFVCWSHYRMWFQIYIYIYIYKPCNINLFKKSKNFLKTYWERFVCKIDKKDQVCLSSILQFVLMEKDFAYQYTNTDKYEKGIYISSPHICVRNKRNSYWIHLFVILLLGCIYMKQTLFTSFLHNK